MWKTKQNQNIIFFLKKPKKTNKAGLKYLSFNISHMIFLKNIFGKI